MGDTEAVPRTAWTATAIVDGSGWFGPVEMTMTPVERYGMVPDGIPHIRVSALEGTLDFGNRLVNTKWEVLACALTGGEAYERVREAEPAIRENLPALRDTGLFYQRWFRLVDGELLDPCTHPDAVPVDIIITGEIVAWLCPECDVQLPADWGA